MRSLGNQELDLLTDINEYLGDIISSEEVIEASRVYVRSPQEVPEGITVERGPKGGYYYESSKKTLEKPLKIKWFPIYEPLNTTKLEIIKRSEFPEETKQMCDFLENYAAISMYQQPDSFINKVFNDTRNNIIRDAEKHYQIEIKREKKYGAPETLEFYEQMIKPGIDKLVKRFDEAEDRLDKVVALDALVHLAHEHGGEGEVGETWVPMLFGIHDYNDYSTYFLQQVLEYLSSEERKMEKSFIDIRKSIRGIPIEAGRIYISSPTEAPEGIKVEQGPRGGYYYEGERREVRGRPRKETISEFPELIVKPKDKEILDPMDEFAIEDKDVEEARWELERKESEAEEKAETFLWDQARERLGIEKHPDSHFKYDYLYQPVTYRRGKKILTGAPSKRKEEIWFSNRDMSGPYIDDTVKLWTVGNRDTEKQPDENVIIDPNKKTIMEERTGQKFTYSNFGELNDYLLGRYELSSSATKNVLKDIGLILDKNNYDPKKEPTFSGDEVKKFTELQWPMSLLRDEYIIKKYPDMHKKIQDIVLNNFEKMNQDELFRFLEYDFTHCIVHDREWDEDVDEKWLDIYTVPKKMSDPNRSRISKYARDDNRDALLGGIVYLDKEHSIKMAEWMSDIIKLHRQKGRLYPFGDNVLKELYTYGSSSETRMAVYKSLKGSEYAQEPKYSPFLPNDEHEQKRKALKDWLMVEGTAESVWMMAAANKVFNHKDKCMHYWKWLQPGHFRILNDPDVQYTNLIQNLYKDTQEYYKKKKITELTIYRGVSRSVALNSPLESWSLSESSARKFDGGEGGVFSITVPVDRVLMGHKPTKDYWLPDTELRGKQEVTVIGLKDEKSIFEEFKPKFTGAWMKVGGGRGRRVRRW